MLGIDLDVIIVGGAAGRCPAGGYRRGWLARREVGLADGEGVDQPVHLYRTISGVLQQAIIVIQVRAGGGGKGQPHARFQVGAALFGKVQTAAMSILRS